MDTPTNDNSRAGNPYFGLRRQVFDMAGEMEGMSDMHPINAAVVDMDMGSAVVSLVCVADGTVSLYFSNGGGQLGLGQADENIRKAAIAFLSSADQVLGITDIMDAMEDFPLPRDGKHFVHLISPNCVYRKELDMKSINEEPRESQFLNFLYQNVLAKIGEHNQHGK